MYIFPCEVTNVVYLSAVGILGCKEKKLSHCVKRTSNYMKNFGGTLEATPSCLIGILKYEVNLEHENKALEQRTL